MAKELCMIENNAKGREARRYFIQRDKELTALENPANPLDLSTPSQRKLLNKAVAYLVHNSPLDYDGAWMMVNLQMGVESCKDLTAAQVPEAVKLTGKLLQEFVHQGEHQTRDEVQAQSQSTIKEETINAAQQKQLKQAIGALMRRWPMNGLNTNYVYDGLRKTFNLHSIKDLPQSKLNQAQELLVKYDTMILGFCDVMGVWRDEMVKQTFAQGLPMTAKLKSEWKKKIGTELGDRPDWVSIGKELEMV